MDSQSINYEQAEKLAGDWTKAQPTVAAFVFSLVRDYHITEEILSRVAVILVRKYDTYNPQLPFTHWALRIARYETLKYRRSDVRDRHQFSSELMEEMSMLCDAVVDEMDPRMSYLEECLKRIQGRARQALVLRYVADLKPAKIAESLQVSNGAVRMLLSRTRDALRSCIERRLNEEGA